jgi:hypothetical protein
MHTLRVLTALGTTGAVIALVFLETIRGVLRSWREWRRRPILSLTHDPSVDVAREVVGTVEQTTPAAYVRLGVENEPGRRNAPAVEVTVKRVDQIDGDPNDNMPTHNMGPLGWTHRDPLLSQLGPGARRTVVLGAHPATGSVVIVGLGVPPPLTGVDVLTSGTYRFVLTVSAQNVDAQDWTLDLWHDGQLTTAGKVGEHVKVTDGPRRV